MEDVRLNKRELRERVQANRDQHRTKFEEALGGYRTLVIKKLEEHIDRIKNGAVEEVDVHVPSPVDHTADYDAVIEMLKMSVDDEVVLSQREFRKLVLDEWSWKQDFNQTHAYYTQP